MREIKFRGKAKMTIEELDYNNIPHKNGWIIGNLIKNGNRPVISSDVYELIEESIYPKWWAVVEFDSVGQYTGLKDKNGREIFEGDILEIITSKIKGRVVMINGSYMLNINNRAYSLSDVPKMYNLHDIRSSCFLVGNIHDNPELITSD